MHEITETLIWKVDGICFNLIKIKIKYTSN